MSESILKAEAQANAVARLAMGEVAWPTIVLAAGLFTAYPAVLIGFAMGSLPLWVATLLLSVIVYASYTVLHEAVHGSINGQNRSLKWANDALGYIAGQIIGTSMLAHRKEHLAHHIHTNIEGQDPDLPLAGRPGFYLVLGAIRALPYQLLYYLRTHWVRASTRERGTIIFETVFALAWRLGVVYALGWTAAFWLLVVANLVGIFITVVLFAWIVHHPHKEFGRYKDTAAFVFPKPFDTLISGLWLFQNYHAIHHLFPRVPFYRYRQVFNQIEPVMKQNRAPIHRWPQGRSRLRESRSS